MTEVLDWSDAFFDTLMMGEFGSMKSLSQQAPKPHIQG